MRRSLIVLAGSLLIIATFALACGDSDDDNAIDLGDGNKATAFSNALPDDFPDDFPIYDDAELQGGVQAELAAFEDFKAFTVGWTTTDCAGDVRAFYDEDFADGAWTSSASDGNLPIWEAHNEDESKVAYLSVVEADGETVILVNLGDDAEGFMDAYFEAGGDDTSGYGDAADNDAADSDDASDNDDTADARASDCNSQDGVAISDRLPDNFPDDFPIYDAAELQGSLSDPDGFAVTWRTDDSVADVSAFYDEALSAGPWRSDTSGVYDEIAQWTVANEDADWAVLVSVYTVDDETRILATVQ